MVVRGRPHGAPVRMDAGAAHWALLGERVCGKGPAYGPARIARVAGCDGGAECTRGRRPGRAYPRGSWCPVVCTAVV